MKEVYGIQKTFTYADTSSTLLGQLPPNAFITSIKVIITTAFNAPGNDYLDIGTSSSAARYADDVDCASTGSATVTSTAYWGYVESAADPTDIYYIFVPGTSVATAGEGKIVVEYVFNE